MKIKIVFCIILGTILCNVARSQDISVKNIANIEINGAKKIDLAAGKASKLGKKKLSILADRTSEIGQLYELNNMLLFINGEATELKPDHLERMDKGFKEMSEWRPGDPENSKIETFGQYRVLTMDLEFSDQGTGRYSFFAQSKNNKRILVGVLEYDLSDKLKAKEALGKFIKHIKFK